MSKQETNFYNRVNKYLDKYVYYMKNNNPYIGGIPDFWYSKYEGRDCWVEYKCLDKLPVRDSTQIKVELSELQLHWIRNRRAEGRNVFVVVGVAGGGGVVMLNGEWEEAWDCARFKAAMIPVKGIAEHIMMTLSC